jgi:hypothetical protein
VKINCIVNTSLIRVRSRIVLCYVFLRPGIYVGSDVCRACHCRQAQESSPREISGFAVCHPQKKFLRKHRFQISIEGRGTTRRSRRPSTHIRARRTRLSFTFYSTESPSLYYPAQTRRNVFVPPPPRRRSPPRGR